MKDADFCMWFTIMAIGLALCATVAHAFDCMYRDCGCPSDDTEDGSENGDGDGQ